jgi:hypothetical protein
MPLVRWRRLKRKTGDDSTWILLIDDDLTAS